MADETTANLFASLLEWDGKSASAIGNIYGQHASRADFLNAVLELCASSQVERGATWLLKHHSEQKAIALDQQQTQALHSAMTGVQHWEARLHILQAIWSFEHIGLQREIAKQFIEEGLGSENKFVRAWSYYGMAELAVQFPDLQPHARKALEAALEKENAGSIKARIKKGLKRLG